jgi:3,4-dihydroxy 2-butanone 4-phosphate synthase/GTP cyclohydrolase II
MTYFFASVEQAISELQAGRMVILMDDEDRENEGDLVIAADHITPLAINFMSRFGRGLICLPMAQELVDKLALPMMAHNNRSPYGTAFTVSIEAATGVTTGISASDRARTIKVAIDPKSGPDDVISPGHIFPLRAHPGGVLKRPGQTEGSIDLMRLAGLSPAAVICEIINEDGTMSRRDDLALFSKQHNIPLVTVKSLIDYRITYDTLVESSATARVPLMGRGDFSMTIFNNAIDDAEHFSLVKAPLKSNPAPLLRIHSECVTGDVFGSCRCDCGSQLQQSLDLIAKEGGILIYLRQEGRGIGLSNKLKAYALQEKGLDTVDANIKLGLPVDSRDYGVAFQILKYLKVSSVRLITNNPEKIRALERYGVNILERIPLVIESNPENRGYLKVKQEKLGHLLEIY